MNTIKVLSFFKEQWLGSALIIIWLLSIVLYQNDRDQLVKESETLKTKIESLEKKAAAYKKEESELKKIDTIIVDRIKKIKEKEYVQIKVIDSLPISGLQKFFTDRYSEER
jgi:protein subunit release factor B